MSEERVAPESKGVTVKLLASIDLGPEIEGMAGRQLRMRMVTIEPGGVFGPVHDHKGRPGTVYVLEGGVDSGIELEKGVPRAMPAGYEEAHSRDHMVSPHDLHSMHGSTRIVFTGTSEEFSAGHVPFSRWLPRGWLELWADDIIPGKESTVLVTDSDGVGAVLAAQQLRSIGYLDVLVLEGGIAAWRKDGSELETGLTGVMRAPDDILPVRRSYAEMLNYLRWEEALGEKYKAQA
jgi:rhodanese-related sulfurtransferase